MVLQKWLELRETVDGIKFTSFIISKLEGRMGSDTWTVEAKLWCLCWNILCCAFQGNFAGVDFLGSGLGRYERWLGEMAFVVLRRVEREGSVTGNLLKGLKSAMRCIGSLRGSLTDLLGC